KDLVSEDAFKWGLDFIDRNIHRIYAGGPGRERVQGFIQEAQIKGTKAGSIPWERWSIVSRLFSHREGADEPKEIVGKALRPSLGARPIVVVDLSRRPPDIAQSAWDEKIKP